MNTLCLAGLAPFGLLAPVLRSPALAIVFVQGVAFHTNPGSNLLFTLDTTTNATLLAIGSTQHPHIPPLVAVCALAFAYNLQYGRDDRWADARHVVFVQWVALLAIYVLWRHDPSNPYFFLPVKSQKARNKST